MDELEEIIELARTPLGKEESHEDITWADERYRGFRGQRARWHGGTGTGGDVGRGQPLAR